MRAVRRLVLLLLTAACAPPALAPPPAVDERAALRRVIDSMLAAPETRHARWGVLIVDPDASDTLYSRDAGKLLMPASNQKIITSAVALDALGPGFTFSTLFLGRGELRSDTLRGDLLVVGLGDPSISDHMAGDAMLPLRAFADSLRTRGVRHVRGRVLPAGNAFPDANAGFGWQLEDLDYPYGAVVDELLFNEGFSEIEVTGAQRAGDAPLVRTSPARTFPRVRVEATTAALGVGPDSVARLDAVKDTVRGDVVLTGTIPVGDSATVAVTHRDPTAAYIAALREALLDRNITIGGDSAAVTAERVDTLFVAQSPPLSQILAFFMKPSQNQIGEMLFKAVALQRADTGSARVARRVFSERDGFFVSDGSGLSRRDLVSPETIVRVLAAMRRSPHFQSYYDSFPIAGVDGTLRSRMRSTSAEANVRGKTGTLGNVRSLSGYVTTAGGRQLIFSVLANNYLTSTDYISRVQDTIGVRLARMRGTGAAR
jgi:D-alanyl-D-alanine carboxypeptidase/D-alanyl-D-alanine-endopeptidase (penicillin-binding protein 4)